MNPKISVVVPVYKVQAYLAECLNSVLSQSFKDIEIICVDDASPDLSPAILRKFATTDKRIKVITHKQNKGVSCARNLGISMATGKYVHIMDSDDMLKPDCYECMWDLVTRHNFPELAVFHIQTLYDMLSKSLVGLDVLESPEEKAKILGSQYPWYKFSRTDFVQKFMFPIENRGGSEDVPWSWMVVISAQKIPVYPKKFYYYRKLATSLSHTKSMSKNKFLCDSYASTKQWLMQNGYWDVAVYKNRFNQMMSSARNGFMLKHGSKDEINKVFEEYPILQGKDDSTDYLQYMKK
jgi:glycosyltransferase involved in cell wall biosynthesis